MDKPTTFHEKLCPRLLLQRALAVLALDADRPFVLPALPPSRPRPDLDELFACGRMWG